MARTLTVEVAVVGGGPAGLTAAIAFACAGVETALIGPRPADDLRTTALLGSSVTALQALGVWPDCAEWAAPLRRLRIVDDTGRLIRAPEVQFEADEIGLDAFGYNIENRHLLRALAKAADAAAPLARFEQPAAAVEPGADAVTVALLDGGSVSARLVVAADGRRSICRSAAGIETERRSYPQTALTFNLRHTRPHHDTSTEFHTADGPFTLVPLPGLRSSLVWVTAPRDAGRISELGPDALAGEIERHSHSILGRIAPEPGHGRFPLSVETARSFAQSRIALVGEAAHLFPPIGAQGLNLGLRDAAAIAELAVAARRLGGDVGADDLLDRYDKLRRGDVTARTLAVDLLNRTLLTDFLPAQTVRGFGLYLLDRVGPLRRAAMREGIAPAAWQPRLMRGEAL